MLSAMLAGLAGALYVPQVGIINPGEFSPANSIEIVIWVAVGGRGLLLGAVLGAVLVNSSKATLHRLVPQALDLCAGRAVHLVTLFLPRAVLDGLDALGGLRPSRRPDPRKEPEGRARDVGPGEGSQRLEPAE